MCLSLMIEKAQTDDNKTLELCRIYKKIEETFEMKGKSSELVYALVYNRAGYEDRATDSIIRYLESCITDETVIPNPILFSPTIKFKPVYIQTVWGVGYRFNQTLQIRETL